MPSKKNNYRHSLASKKVYIPKSIAKEIDYFLWQVKSLRSKGLIPKEPISCNIEVTTLFHGRYNKDLDNMVTTLLDILQKGRIIENDKQVRRILAERIDGPMPYINVEISESFPPTD